VHDARHFYAIRAVRAGTPYELVARQLGHADVQMVAKVYGRYAPTSDERDRWEKVADQLDAAQEVERQKPKKVDEMGTPVGTTPQNDSSQPRVSNWPDDIRGRTRTHAPGIRIHELELPLRGRDQRILHCRLRLVLQGRDVVLRKCRTQDFRGARDIPSAATRFAFAARGMYAAAAEIL
jgi:hypothetical protein